MDDKQLVLAKKFVEKERKKLDLHFFIQDQQLYQRRTCSKQFRHERKLLIKKYKEQHIKLHKALLFAVLLVLPGATFKAAPRVRGSRSGRDCRAPSQLLGVARTASLRTSADRATSCRRAASSSGSNATSSSGSTAIR